MNVYDCSLPKLRRGMTTRLSPARNSSEWVISDGRKENSGKENRNELVT